MLKRLLAHPLTQGLDINDPKTTARRREIILSKPFLKRVYEDWYTRVVTSLPDASGPSGALVEIGSGGGFFDQIKPETVTSEIFFLPSVRAVLDATALPFQSASLRALVMVDVLHHICAVRDFLAEASRCVAPGGRIIMIEPWVSAWSRYVYGRLHHEPFRPDAVDWEFPSCGPLSGANGALPWIIFERDRSSFETDFPEWCIERVEPFMPFRYLFSGGVSLRSLAPNLAYQPFVWLERFLTPYMERFAMFAHIVITRTEFGTSLRE
ncbi:class I SAM-dependent methyltransferase [Desulfovibrio inopinatus]|uniref:class I SAM-dependent methyltransferase n=1 Tax=Desulfovibrio inopinatus TaxID=102109 RepID=UPI0004242A17|nr:methyltransferase domain-containing protein [Desulfovibrio inopinatus]